MNKKLLQDDILQRIMKDFTGITDRVAVINLFQSVSQEAITVGMEQLQRSILVIAAGNFNEVQRIFDTGFYGDPRDLIMIAEAKAGYPGSYGSLAFQ